jgi:hypothetical protein
LAGSDPRNQRADRRFAKSEVVSQDDAATVREAVEDFLCGLELSLEGLELEPTSTESLMTLIED